MFFESAKSILLIVSALFPLVNPIGGSPVFLLLTQEYATQERKLLARHVDINSFILLIVSFVILASTYSLQRSVWLKPRH